MFEEKMYMSLMCMDKIWRILTMQHNGAEAAL